MDAREYLTSYAGLKMEARNNEERIAEAFNETLIPAMAQSDGSQRTPGRGDRQEKASIRYIEIKDRLQPMIDASKARMREIEDTISSLPDPMHREVLRLRYIDTDNWNPVKWRLVAMVMYGDDDDKDILRTKRLHREALDTLDAVLAATEEMKQ